MTKHDNQMAPRWPHTALILPTWPQEGPLGIWNMALSPENFEKIVLLVYLFCQTSITGLLYLAFVPKQTRKRGSWGAVWVPDGPKMASRWLQDGPRWPHDASHMVP